jgi:23S rRNA pseudouridine1911/1915/1917 synthase
MEDEKQILEGFVPAVAAGQRLDKVLAQVFPPYSRSQLQAWLEQGRITLAGTIPSRRQNVSGGEALRLELPPPPESAWIAQPLPLTIVFADADIAVIDKPAGLVVHPGAGNPGQTLANAVLHRYPEVAALPRAGIVHRLDKDTSGLLVLARSARARTALIRDLERRSVKRDYLAMVTGCPIAGGTIAAAVGRHPRHRLKMAVTDKGKPALTHYRVERRFRAHTLLRVSLETGRTHQIRVHMAHIGFPLLGDPLYGGRLKMPPGATVDLTDQLRGFRRQALHAQALALTHPVSGESLHWQSPLPTDFQDLIDILAADAVAES